MCLVEASNAPKLVPACQTPLAEGQVVKTNTAKVKDQQRAVLEFLLLNHPVDCAICDQAGECKLQDYYMRYDHKPSRLEGGKVLKNKRKELGPLVVLDQERCILCTRCVRFMEEVAQGAAARRLRPRLARADRRLPGRAARLELLGQHRRHLPGRRAAQPRLPLPRPRLVPLDDAVGVHRLLARLLDVRRLLRPGDLPLPAARERADQQELDVRPRPALVQVPEPRPRAEPALGRGADRVEATVAEAAPGRRDEAAGARRARSRCVASPVSSNEDLLAGLSFAKETLGAKVVYVSGRAPGQGRPLPDDRGQEPEPQGPRARSRRASASR